MPRFKEVPMLRKVSPIALLLVCALSACGGGGGDTATPAPAPTPTPTPAPTPTPTPAPTPTPPPPATIPPLAQPPMDISGETTTIGTSHWTPSPSAGQGAPVDGIPCGSPVETFHIHSHVTVALNGQLLEVPGQIGILPTTATSGGCTYQIHTHDGSGSLHIETPAPANYTLGNFFHIWG